MQPVYFLLNRLNNALPDRGVDPRLRIRHFAAHLDERPEPESRASSPSRILSDLFWMSLPWRRIMGELGEIHMLDLGCGNGAYARRLQAWSGGRLASYAGIDGTEREAWSTVTAVQPWCRFAALPAQRFGELFGEETSMLISQSALEHFDDDLGLFRLLRDRIQQRRGPFLQIHLVPSAACLDLYRLHGIRQYTPRTLSKISRLFGGIAECTLFTLGGDACNALHHEFITAPLQDDRGEDRRFSDPDEYARRLRAAIAKDAAHSPRRPSFYALVIHSNAASDLFGSGVGSQHHGEETTRVV